MSTATNANPFGDSDGVRARISGTVRTFDGHDVANAKIEARDTQRKNNLFTAHSDSRGSFALYDILPGDYDVTVTNGGAQSTQRVHVDSRSGFVSVDFRVPNSLSADDQRAGNRSTVSVAQYSVPPKARSLFEKATQLKIQGKLDESREKVNAALAIYPKYSQALTLRGMLEENAGKKEEAKADYKQAIQFDAAYPVAYLALGSLLNSTGQFQESLPILAQAERLDPSAWQIQFELARANLVKGDFALALRQVDRAAELQGGPQKASPEIHLIRGYTFLGLKDIPQAVQEVNVYLAHKPSGPAADEARHVLAQLNDQSATASR
jgi:tetratricopeptide (TPR) repeat protein